jgi:gamma-glutamyltranspeptidase/glutathione hydrolase
MTLADLAGYRAPFRDPTRVGYRGYDVYSMAPSSSGGATVGEALNILSNFDLGAESQVQVLHHYLEASRLAFADRNRYIGDPAYVQVPLTQLLSPDFVWQRACLIDPAHALTSPVAPGDPFAGSGGCIPQQPAAAADAYPETDTNHLVVADRYGDVASYTNTIEELGGSGIVVPGRGFLLNNELTDFDFAPPSSGRPDPNLPAAGKRPRSSMSPTIVLEHGRPVLALGAAGGATIITTVLQTLINRIDLHMSLPAAVAAPRASQRNATSTQAEPDFIAEPTTPALEQLGQSFAVTDTSPLNPAIQIAPTIGAESALELSGHGRMLAAAEPVRRGGGSAGVVSPRP